MNLNEPMILSDIGEDVLKELTEEFAVQSTAMLLTNAKRHLGPRADTGPEITNVLMELSRAAFAAGFKVAQRIHRAEVEH